MRQKSRLYRPVFYLMLMEMAAVSLAALYFDITFFYTVVAISLISLGLTLFYIVRADREVDRFVAQLGDQISKMQTDTLVSLPMPVMVADDKGELLWYNDCCRTKLFYDGERFGHPISEILGEINGGEADSFSIEFKDRSYTVYSARGMRDNSKNADVETERAMFIYYLCDDTDLKRDAEQYWASRPSMLAIMIDSLDEALQDAKENERSQLMAQVEYVIEQFVGDHDGFVIKTDRDRFFAVIEERHMPGIVEKRFALLDRVRALSSVDKIPVTLSIGVARNVASYPEGEQAARQALDMAQGRGGDQAAVKTPNGYDFYGGVSKGIEKRTKVKTRIVATALAELIDSSSNVIIMGHKFADLDSLGAAVGLLRPIRQMGKHAVIAINRSRNLVKTLIDRLEKNGYENSFLDPFDIMNTITPNTLLIIVDTHLEHVLESVELYRACKNVAIIDHHRRMVGYIDNAVIFYHEPYASSASEMVTELIQYFGDKHRITRAEAEALLAGIMLDTRNFVIRTGVRTFEAAAYLRRQGADTVEVRKLFSSSMEFYQRRARVVSSAEIYHRCAIATATAMNENIKLVAPQAADELLNISDVDASFVLYEYDDGISISARSMGKMNVQVIMETLGGGGHQTMAATQIPTISMEDARQKLLEAIEEYTQQNHIA
ncbi:MAG: DHH family phosphoesterase [Candidatus Fimivivens sp.]|nr:DHH family phosphoesterase [Candidatus Fimivivens sp.]